MSMINYHDPTVIQMNLDDNGKEVSLPMVNEAKQVVDGKIPLEGLPDEQYRIQITGYVEINIKDKIDAPNKFKCDYTHGILYFDQSKNGASINIDKYYSRGQFYISASRVWTKLDNLGNVSETLTDVENSLRTAVDMANDVQGVINTGNQIKVDLNTSISGANAINNALSHTATGTIKKATDINTTLSATVGIANISKTNLDGSISTANTTKNSLDQGIASGGAIFNAIADANTATQNTNTATSNANAKIVDVESRFQTLTTAQQQDAEVIDARQGKESLGENLTAIRSTTIHKGDTPPVDSMLWLDTSI